MAWAALSANLKSMAVDDFGAAAVPNFDPLVGVDVEETSVAEGLIQTVVPTEQLGVSVTNFCAAHKGAEPNCATLHGSEPNLAVAARGLQPTEGAALEVQAPEMDAGAEQGETYLGWVGATDKLRER
mmetsp:Transcript_32171/g.106397  ORF Transcript_32171/g.106397 Transcript_32171/m.106397 type:complete len:127 (-) Transcript_32171:563-943(-)